MKAPTPHIAAKIGDFGKTVIMPGDPLRAKFAAENYLTDPVLVNNVRGVQGYTGTYNGVKVSVMASGMGIPSISIYANELFEIYGVENIIRVGSAGAIREDLPLRSVVLANGASTDSSLPSKYGLSGQFAPVASYHLLKAADNAASRLGIKARIGSIFSTDSFYNETEGYLDNWRKMGILCVEMEAAGLYTVAARKGKNALAILTVSDNLATGETTTSAERQLTFRDMLRIAFAVATEE